MTSSVCGVIAAASVSALLAACTGTPAEPAMGPAPDSTYLSFTSDPWEWIGLGQSRHYTYEDGNWAAFFVRDGRGEHILLAFNDGVAGGEYWSLEIARGSGQRLGVGHYPDAVTFPDNSSGQPGLTFQGDFRFCPATTGEFTIDYLKAGRDSTIAGLNVAFTQNCDGGTLSGEFVIAADPWR